MKTTGHIKTPTDRLKSLIKEKSKILVPKISASIAFVTKIPERKINMLLSFFSSSTFRFCIAGEFIASLSLFRQAELSL